MDQCLPVVEKFFDHTNAYDIHNHNTSLAKLNSYGIRGNTNLWFKYYLSDHSQFVVITQTEHRNFP